MTGQEMVYSFMQLLETVSPKFILEQKVHTYEIVDYLNRTVDRYIKLKYFSGETFKRNIFKVGTAPDDLARLYQHAELTPTIVLDGPPNFYYVALSDGFLGYIRSDSEVTRVTVHPMVTAWVPNIEIDWNDLDPLITTPFNKVILESPVVTIEGSYGVEIAPTAEGAGDIRYLTILTDSYTTLHKVKLQYIEHPILIENKSTSICNLADHLHEEIVKLAVSMYLDEYKLKLAGTQQTK